MNARDLGPLHPGDELLLSPKWSFVATRPDQGVGWRRGATTPRFVGHLAAGGLGSMFDEGGEEEAGRLDLVG